MLQSQITLALVFATAISAYPFMNLPSAGLEALARAESNKPNKRQDPPIFTFDAKSQLVSNSGAHAFVPPGAGDIRGPCPGLNALANHNYLPHSGVIGLQQAIDATNAGFGMGVDLGQFLSVYATLIDGDPLSMMWSIGGAPPSSVLGGLLSKPQGLSGSHNKYESDASPGRGDSFLHGGDASSLQLANFQALYGLQAGDTGGNYNLDVLTTHAQNTITFSRQNNPQFFWGPFTGLLVSQAAHTFIPRFMSNHSAEHPDGILDQSTLKSFFGVTGNSGSLVINRGQERIPDNWYRRPLTYPYSVEAFLIDAQSILAKVPERAAVGGNLGVAGSFAGVDVSDITGGVYNSQNLLTGDNLICFGVETILAFTPDILKTVVLDVTSALNLLTSKISPSALGITCPQLKFYNKDYVSKFPGAGAGI